MSKVRNIIVGASVAVLPLALAASPAGAAQSHPKFIRAIEREAPGLKRYTNASLNRLGVAVCSDLNSGTSVLGVVESLVQDSSQANAKLTDKQDGVVLADSIIYICPTASNIAGLKQFIADYGNSQSSVTSSNGVVA